MFINFLVSIFLPIVISSNVSIHPVCVYPKLGCIPDPSISVTLYEDGSATVIDHGVEISACFYPDFSPTLGGCTPNRTVVDKGNGNFDVYVLNFPEFGTNP